MGKYTLLIWAVLLCCCSYIPNDKPLLEKTDQFIKAIEANQPLTAWQLLTKETQVKIDHKQLSSDDGDFRAIVETFSEADISIGPQDGRRISIVVSPLDGQEGVLSFVMIYEDDEWRIANIYVNNK